MILTGIDELHPDETGLFTLWEWQSRISLPFTTIDINAMAATDEEEQQTTIMPALRLQIHLQLSPWSLPMRPCLAERLFLKAMLS